MSAFLAAVIVKSECNLMLVWEGDWDLERWVRRAGGLSFLFFLGRANSESSKTELRSSWLAPFQQTLPNAVLSKNNTTLTNWLDPSPGSHTIRRAWDKILLSH